MDYLPDCALYITAWSLFLFFLFIFLRRTSLIKTANDLNVRFNFMLHLTAFLHFLKSFLLYLKKLFSISGLQPMLLQRGKSCGCCVIVTIIVICALLLIMSILLGVFCATKHLCKWSNHAISPNSQPCTLLHVIIHRVFILSYMYLKCIN